MSLVRREFNSSGNGGGGGGQDPNNRGVYTSLAALEAVTGTAGDWAIYDAPGSGNAVIYVWDNDSSTWEAGDSLVAPVLGIVTTLPASPSAGDRYIFTGTGTNQNDIAQYSGSAWQYETPTDGLAVYNSAAGVKRFYLWNGNSWITENIYVSSITWNGNIMTVLRDGSTNFSVTAPLATTSTNGMMSSADKAKLDRMDDPNVYFAIPAKNENTSVDLAVGDMCIVTGVGIETNNGIDYASVVGARGSDTELDFPRGIAVKAIASQAYVIGAVMVKGLITITQSGLTGGVEEDRVFIEKTGSGQNETWQFTFTDSATTYHVGYIDDVVNAANGEYDFWLDYGLLASRSLRTISFSGRTLTATRENGANIVVSMPVATDSTDGAINAAMKRTIDMAEESTTPGEVIARFGQSVFPTENANFEITTTNLNDYLDHDIYIYDDPGTNTQNFELGQNAYDAIPEGRGFLIIAPHGTNPWLFTRQSGDAYSIFLNGTEESDGNFTLNFGNAYLAIRKQDGLHFTSTTKLPATQGTASIYTGNATVNQDVTIARYTGTATATLTLKNTDRWWNGTETIFVNEAPVAITLAGTFSGGVTSRTLPALSIIKFVADSGDHKTVSISSDTGFNSFVYDSLVQEATNASGATSVSLAPVTLDAASDSKTYSAITIDDVFPDGFTPVETANGTPATVLVEGFYPNAIGGIKGNAAAEEVEPITSGTDLFYDNINQSITTDEINANNANVLNYKCGFVVSSRYRYPVTNAVTLAGSSFNVSNLSTANLTRDRTIVASSSASAINSGLVLPNVAGSQDYETVYQNGERVVIIVPAGSNNSVVVSISNGGQLLNQAGTVVSSLTFGPSATQDIAVILEVVNGSTQWQLVDENENTLLNDVYLSIQMLQKSISLENRTILRRMIPGFFHGGDFRSTSSTQATFEAWQGTSDDGEKFFSHTDSITLSLSTVGAGGRDTSAAIQNNTFYHCFRIYNPTTGNIAMLASTSLTSPTLPSGYTRKRYSGVVRCISTAGAIRSFTCSGADGNKKYVWETEVLSISNASISSAAAVSSSAMQAVVPQTPSGYPNVTISVEFTGANLVLYHKNITSGTFAFLNEPQGSASTTNWITDVLLHTDGTFRWGNNGGTVTGVYLKIQSFDLEL